MADWLSVLALPAILAGWLVFVHRPVQAYSYRQWFDATPEEAIALFSFMPGEPVRHPAIAAIEWIDEARGLRRIRYSASPMEVHLRDLPGDDPWVVRSEGGYFDARRGTYFDTFEAVSRYAPKDGGCELAGEVRILRGPLWPFRAQRLGYPVMGLVSRGMLAAVIAHYRAERGEPAPRAPQSLVGQTVAALGGWPAVLSVAAIIWFIVDFGLWAGLALISLIVVHEYGHLWSLRRHGHDDARATLVPFLGGVAYSKRPMATDAADAEMTLMGPAFGLAFALALYALGQLTGSGWLEAAAGFAAFVNGVNLAPVPPLDGGRIAQLFMRVLGETVWLALSLVLIALGAAYALWIGSTLLLVLLVLNGALLASARRVQFNRPRLDGVGMGLAAGAYLGLAAIHVWLILGVLDGASLGALFRWVEAGPL